MSNAITTNFNPVARAERLSPAARSIITIDELFQSAPSLQERFGSLMLTAHPERVVGTINKTVVRIEKSPQ